MAPSRALYPCTATKYMFRKASTTTTTIRQHLSTPRVCTYSTLHSPQSVTQHIFVSRASKYAAVYKQTNSCTPRAQTFSNSAIRRDSDAAPTELDDAERAVYEKLSRELKPSELSVRDISGGCGSMYALDIAADAFKGMSVVKQHQLVNRVLKDEIASWHGVQIKTRAA